ncbi:hypothetical protein K431DRAFT_97986 [Polychaeton citri CBS 116435]|uniref:Uncharacterized protein n=1 Tax=Polychaeton citri CBS 116435 TaxID=1314669 RepID=A0A9P4USK2_9PEZI|nr:hypothetical protein K431DRAFT_97986 [Polychaeton citri CBS 116435]
MSNRVRQDYEHLYNELSSCAADQVFFFPSLSLAECPRQPITAPSPPGAGHAGRTCKHAHASKAGCFTSGVVRQRFQSRSPRAEHNAGATRPVWSSRVLKPGFDELLVSSTMGTSDGLICPSV